MNTGLYVTTISLSYQRISLFAPFSLEILFGYFSNDKFLLPPTGPPSKLSPLPPLAHSPSPFLLQYKIIVWGVVAVRQVLPYIQVPCHLHKLRKIEIEIEISNKQTIHIKI